MQQSALTKFVASELFISFVVVNHISDFLFNPGIFTLILKLPYPDTRNVPLKI